MTPPGPGIRIGVDLGGTKIEVIAIDRGGTERFRRRTPTPSGDYDATVRTIAALVGEADAAAAGPAAREAATVGVGIPGTVSPATGLVKNANSQCLIGRALDRDLERALNRPVRLANDADCFTLSEATDGAGASANIVFGVILGTGVGGGICVGKKILRGPNAITGEWGHNPLPWPDPAAGELPGPACYCGHTGCIETFLSGPGLARDAGCASATEAAALAAEGNAEAAAAMSRYVERLARATASVINVLDPDVIVLGGGLSRIGRLYSGVPPLWPRHVFSDTVATRLLPPAHGDSSGVRGAAWLWD